MTEPLALTDSEEAQALSGPRDQVLRLLRQRFGVEIVLRNLELRVQGERAGPARELLAQLLAELRDGTPVTFEDVEARVTDLLGPTAPEERTRSGRLDRLEGFRLRTDGQRRYVDLMDEAELVFAIGPAGTGKTFLAVLKAVQLLKAGAVARIILCRPAVEAGESLGFLPGDYQAKVNPYMRPLYDALYTVLDFDTVKRYQEREVVEVAPLAYMRGRTLNEAFVILDEAQNTTRAQMKMFLTRMGERSRIVVTGDVTQIDLPQGTTSGLVHAQAILQGVKGIGFATLKNEDIVRHRLVWQILEAYEGGQARAAGGQAARKKRARR
ncbi:MAG: PhoH family protein [Planctomycetota bacterium]